MFRRFTDHPATVNETYLEHMSMAFGFGGRMFVGSLACFVHGLFPWLCLTRGSDTIRALHRRMVMHRVARPTDTADRGADPRPDRRVIAAE
jgi:hypothetical protein